MRRLLLASFVSSCAASGSRIRSHSLFLLVIFVVATVQCGAAAKPAGKHVKATAPAQALPIGHLGERYEAKILGVKGIDAGDSQCDSKPELPAGLELDCTTMMIYGFAKSTADAMPVHIEVRDSSKDKADLEFTLTIIDGPDVVRVAPVKAKATGKAPAKTADAGKTAAPATPTVPPAQPGSNTAKPSPVAKKVSLEEIATADPSASSTPSGSSAPATTSQGNTATAAGKKSKKPTDPPASADGKDLGQIVEVGGLVIEATSQIEEGATTVSGKVLGIPKAMTGLKIGLKLTDVAGLSYLAPSTPAKGSSDTPAETTVDKDGTFSMALVAPIPAGVTGEFVLDPPSGFKIVEIDDGEVFKTPFDVPLPRIVVTSLIRDGITVIEGHSGPMPDPAIATNATAKPPVVGNLPRVAVLLHNAGAPENEWVRADLQGATPKTTVTEQEVTTAGGFIVTLASPLAPGGEIEVILLPPVGRMFAGADGRKDRAEWPDGPGPHSSKPVYSSLAITAPVIKSLSTAGAQTISGSATPSVSSATTVSIAMVSDDDYADLADGEKDTPIKACLTPDEAKKYSGRFLPLTLTSGTGAFGTTNATGDFTLTPVTSLVEGQRFHLVEILPANSVPTPKEKELCTTTVTTVKGELDWGRIHADFVAGLLISNDSGNSTAGSATAGSGNFSQAHQFYALNVEKSWSLPGCYLRVMAHREKGTVLDDQCFDARRQILRPAKKWDHLAPGVSTYFQARLTAIPVSTLASNNTMTTAASGGSTTGAASAMSQDATSGGTAAATTATTPTSNLLTTAQTARVEVGAYFPFLITRWEFDRKPNALFIAPLAKVGFDTVTGPSTINTLSATGTIQSQMFEQVYNYWSYGARIGHMQLSRSESRAPETYSYLDIAIGPYSNLQSYICHSSDAKTTLPTGSSCAQYENSHDYVFNAIDSRKRLYRFDIEGLLKIPKTAFYVGLNANIGQKTLGASYLDHGFAAPDDLRFFFGTKFDIASVLMKFNLGPH